MSITKITTPELLDFPNDSTSSANTSGTIIPTGNTYISGGGGQLEESLTLTVGAVNAVTVTVCKSLFPHLSTPISPKCISYQKLLRCTTKNISNIVPKKAIFLDDQVLFVDPLSTKYFTGLALLD